MSSYRIEIQHQHAQHCINRMEEQPRHWRQHQRQVRFSTVKGRGRNVPLFPLQFYPLTRSFYNTARVKVEI